MKKVKYSIKLLKAIGRKSNDGIIVYNSSQQKVEYCNNAFCQIIQIAKTDILGNSFGTFRSSIKDDDHFLHSRFELLKKNGSVTNVELRVKPDKYISCDVYSINEGKLIVALVKDITNIKIHSDYITEFGARKDAILDMVAHNLSGPLNLTNTLVNLIDQLNETEHYRKVDNHTRIIRENTQHCIEIINSFLKEEHLESQHVFVKTNRYDAIEKIGIIIARLRIFDEKKDIKLFSSTRELFVSGDDVKFFQIIHNILSNAMKFTTPQGKIIVEVTDNGDAFSVVIKDNGIGIPEHLHPHIFKKNTLAARPGLRGERSIGMGLYIVARLVALMKGKIRFESEENKGTTFILDFPKN
ncbi:MAG TPA: PAS domain-containing sensor histidine kinase [Ohtaekwangia sp.]|nr:PAS domain-containing sensor histidine kinase [Ohtaekwangia sp.]